MAAQALLRAASVVLLCWRAAVMACEGVGCECVGGWQTGSGWGGTQTYVGDYHHRRQEDCIADVKSRNDGANAATFQLARGYGYPYNMCECYAEYGQTKVYSRPEWEQPEWENCLFDFTFHAGYCYPQSGAPSLSDVSTMSSSYIRGATPQSCYNYCETYDEGSGRTAVALHLGLEKWGGGDPPFCWCKTADIACKRYPSVDVTAIADMNWNSITESYICFTEDFDASERFDASDDGTGYDVEFCELGNGGDDDDDSGDNFGFVEIFWSVVAAVVLVVVSAYFWKRRKSAKPPPQSAPPPPVREPIKATVSGEMPPSTALAEETPAAEGWAAETMAEEAPQPSDGWAARLQLFASWRPSPRQPEGSLEGAAGGSAETMAEEEAPQQSWRGEATETMAAEPPPPPAAEAYAPEPELEPEC
jgi:hypothetical protein